MTRSAILLSTALLLAQPPPPLPPSYQPSAGEIAAIRAKKEQLRARLATLAGKPHYADAAIYHKAVDWVLRHPDEFLTKAYAENAGKVLDAGLVRAEELAAGKPSWVSRKGRVAFAYTSQVDGSLQPYMLLLPETAGAVPMRLDVILHGRNARLTEVSFLADAEFGKSVEIRPDRIELHVYGRTNNAYRWAGETDVFEAIADVKRRYPVDEDRVLLRGFSMGGAGGWHLGFHYPHVWAGIEAGAGFSETQRYARLDNAPPHQQRTWPIYDSYLYAPNAALLPTVGYGSIDDPQLQASVNVKEQLAKENLTPPRALFLVGPRIGHKFAPESKAESEEFLIRHLPRRTPEEFRFVTYTTRYGRYRWLTIDGMERHYERAEVSGNAARLATRNVTRLVFAKPVSITVDGTALRNVTAIEKHGGQWRPAAANSRELRKRRGLQGPIDDAFLESFLVVRGTGKPRNAAAHQLAMSRLETFRTNWAKFLRGDVRFKDDTAVTASDLRSHHLILFGDAGSNSWIARVLPKLPLEWDAATTLLTAIYPNPLEPAKYVVLNSGHTFGEKELRGTNALLFPRLGDWARLDGNGEPVAVGFFDEFWRIPR